MIVQYIDLIKQYIVQEKNIPSGCLKKNNEKTKS